MLLPAPAYLAAGRLPFLAMALLIEPVTPRLRLRQWRDSDFEPFAALNADARVMAHFPSVLDRPASDAMAARCRELIARRGWGFWAVERRGDGRFIGFVGLHEPAAALPFSPCVEIGWRLAGEFWGRGYAGEAARAALGVAFEQLGLPEVVSFTAADNVRSQAVMRRLGMRESGGFGHPAIEPGHRLREHVLFRLARAGWLARSAPKPTAPGVRSR